MRYIGFVFLFFLGFQVQAQLGLSVYQGINNAKDWDVHFQESDLYDFSSDYNIEDALGFSVDWWLRPLEYRIEFLPTLSYTTISNQANANTTEIQTSFDINLIDLSIPIHFYPLDLEGDCDCPTWGKDGTVIKKGFYLSVVPGLSYFNNIISEPRSMSDNFENTSITPHLGIGTGLDIGINKFLTLSPYAKYKIHFNSEWTELSNELSSEKPNIPANSNVNQLQLGLRLGFHFKQ